MEQKKSRLLPAVGLLLLALVAIVLCSLFTESSMMDVTDEEALVELAVQQSGSANVQIVQTAQMGNLFAAYWTAGDAEGLLLFERADSLLSSGWQLVDTAVGGGNLNVYQSDLNGVVTVTALYGTNAAGAAACSLGDADVRTLEAGSTVLELFIQTGSSDAAQTLQVLYG